MILLAAIVVVVVFVCRPRGDRNHPILVAKAALRGAFAVLSSDDEGGIALRFGVIVLRDVIIGLAFGMLLISASIFLDYRGVIHAESAHRFRDAAYRALDDPETRASVEEVSGVKFMRGDEYEAYRETYLRKIDDEVKKLDARRPDLESRTKVVDEKRAEIDSIKDEYDTLVARGNEMFNLDKYCGSCGWFKGTCDERVAFLKSKYGASRLESRIKVMGEAPGCRGE